MIPLQIVVMLFTAVGAVAVVLTRDLVRQAVVFSLYGFSLAALFLVFQAPDVALSSLVVSGAAYPLVLVGAIARVRAMQKRDAE